jgi:hypothetical protein
MRKLSVLLIIAILIGIIGCGFQPSMRLVDPATLNTSVSEDESAVVFIRQKSPFIGSGAELATFIVAIWAFPVGLPALALNPSREVFIFELDEKKDLNFVISPHFLSKFLHKTTSGKHTYLAINREKIHFLEADLEAGKTYYVYVSHDYQWIALYPFIPITPANLSSEKFLEEFRSIRWWEHTDSISEKVITKKQEIIESSWFTDQVKEYENTQEKRTLLLPEYGVDIPIK